MREIYSQRSKTSRSDKALIQTLYKRAYLARKHYTNTTTENSIKQILLPNKQIQTNKAAGRPLSVRYYTANSGSLD